MAPLTYNATVITRMSGYPVRCRVETFTTVAMADGTTASAAVVTVLDTKGLYTAGDVIVVPVALLEAVA